MLPDLDQPVDVAIIPENIHVTGAAYFAWQFEQMRAFRVVDRIVELYQKGLLPLGRGSNPEGLLRGVGRDRLSVDERAAFYRRTLGIRGDAPQGAGGEPRPNREFLSLWLRFLVSVAMFARQETVESLLDPPSAANADVRRAARELAANASLHGYGGAAFAARLAAEVNEAVAVLRDPEIQQAFGARDMWQVIDRVNRRYLGGAVNVRRNRLQADAGRVVLQWLAAHAGQLGAGSSSAPDGSPSDEDLVQAAELWLGATAVADDRVDEHSQPGESPTLSSLPIDLPAIAEDLLEAVGLSEADDAADGERRVLALFHGAVGSGKTLAAHVLAAELGRDILRIDLSQMVSQWAGETEGNLDRIFAEAERTGAVLFFDEADALFGRRTDVKDSHDRYANLDVAYLLQRIESYDGIVVLATNVRSSSDKTSSDDDWRKRLHSVVPFPRPRC